LPTNDVYLFLGRIEQAVVQRLENFSRAPPQCTNEKHTVKLIFVRTIPGRERYGDTIITVIDRGLFRARVRSLVTGTPGLFPNPGMVSERGINFCLAPGMRCLSCHP
jgi:hypothetical protein